MPLCGSFPLWGCDGRHRKCGSGWSAPIPLLKQLIHFFHDPMDHGFRRAEVGDAGAQHRCPVDAGLGHPGDLPPVQRGEKGSWVEMLTRKADQRQWRFVD
jgi:hypothetical protein